MSILEDQLLDTLAKTYVTKGIPLAKLLDNPLFSSFPLEKKIDIFKKYSPVSAKPSIKVKSLVGNAGMGALIGLAAISLKTPSASPLKMALGAGAGAIFGSMAPTIASISNYKRDKSTDDNLRANKFLEAIVERSMSSGYPTPKRDLQSLISKVEGTSYATIANHPAL